MIIVTGATGQLGRAIVDALLQQVPPGEIGVSVRDPGKAADIAARGVRVRRGDFSEPESLADAFDGAEQVVMISSNARSVGGDTIAQHAAAIAAAGRAGVRRIVYTSHMGARSDSAFPPARDHATTEELLRASGIAWTALRNGFYSASALRLLGDVRDTGVVVAPADGKVSWTAHADLAHAAAAITVDTSRASGPSAPLTANAALDLADLAEIASTVLGRAVRRTVQADDDMLSGMSARGVPPAIREIALGMFLASRAGDFAMVDPELERLLGRRSMTVRDMLAAEYRT